MRVRQSETARRSACPPTGSHPVRHRCCVSMRQDLQDRQTASIPVHQSGEDPSRRTTAHHPEIVTRPALLTRTDNTAIPAHKPRSPIGRFTEKTQPIIDRPPGRSVVQPNDLLAQPRHPERAVECLQEAGTMAGKWRSRERFRRIQAPRAFVVGVQSKTANPDRPVSRLSVQSSRSSKRSSSRKRLRCTAVKSSVSSISTRSSISRVRRLNSSKLNFRTPSPSSS